MITTFIGVDAGGSSTHAILVDASATILHAAHGPAGNPYTNGIDSSISALSTLLNQLLTFPLDDTHASPTHASIALSGGDSKEVVDQIKGSLEAALPRNGARVAIRVFHDVHAPVGLIIPSASALRDPDRRAPLMCALIAGTGSVASSTTVIPASSHADASTETSMAVSGRASVLRLETRVGGRGPLVGDDGSAHCIATAVFRGALRVHDGLCEGSLTDVHAIVVAVLREFGLAADDDDQPPTRASEHDVSRLVAALHAETTTRAHIAALAEPFARLAAHGNSIADMAFEQAGDSLAALVCVAVRGAHAESREIRVVATGGVFSALDAVQSFRLSFCRRLRLCRPSVTQVTLVDPSPEVEDSAVGNAASAGAFGAARLGAVLDGMDIEKWPCLAGSSLRHLNINS